MHLLKLARICSATIMALAAIATHASAAPSTSTPPWHINGTLSEACSCSVPCTCNFGESPSPHAFCYAILSMTIDKGAYGDVDLTGLKLGGSNAAEGFVFYIDDRANKAQAAALRAIGTTMWTKAVHANGLKDVSKAPKIFSLRGFKTAHIDQVLDGKSNHVILGKAGRFDAAYIMGMDGKTPLKLANNWSFDITDDIKAKTHDMRYHDDYGNDFNFTGTNYNQGKFDWTDQTPIYFR